MAEDKQYYVSKKGSLQQAYEQLLLDKLELEAKAAKMQGIIALAKDLHTRDQLFINEKYNVNCHVDAEVMLVEMIEALKGEENDKHDS